ACSSIRCSTTRTTSSGPGASGPRTSPWAHGRCSGCGTARMRMTARGRKRCCGTSRPSPPGARTSAARRTTPVSWAPVEPDTPIRARTARPSWLCGRSPSRRLSSEPRAGLGSTRSTDRWWKRQSPQGARKDASLARTAPRVTRKAAPHGVQPSSWRLPGAANEGGRMARAYRLISADSHLEIAPNRWTGRVPAKHRDHAPRLVELEDGGHGVIVENRPLYVLGLAVTGKPYQEHQLSGIRYGEGPGTASPEQRLKEQDLDGVDAEVMYTSAGNGGFWRGIGNDEAYRAVIHAYNEFLAEEYCAVDRDRLLAMPVIPSTSVNDAVAEMEYCKKAGLKGVALNSFPSGKGYPTAEDDRFWAAACDLDMPISVHIGFIGREGPV